jgi:single-strand DNA-binding protein
MYLNKAMIFGNLTRDPELRALPSGVQVCSFSLATNRVYNDRDGNRQESTDYHNIAVFGKQAENCSKYLSKGNSAYVEGRLQTRSFEKEGQKHYRTEIIADRVQFGPKNSSSAENNNSESSTAPSNNASTGAANSASGNDAGTPPAAPEYPEEEINPEDIPF